MLIYWEKNCRQLASFVRSKGFSTLREREEALPVRGLYLGADLCQQLAIGRFSFITLRSGEGGRDLRSRFPGHDEPGTGPYHADNDRAIQYRIIQVYLIAKAKVVAKEFAIPLERILESIVPAMRKNMDVRVQTFSDIIEKADESERALTDTRFVEVDEVKRGRAT